MEAPINTQTTKAILVVSFGTSHEDTRKLTIEAIEQSIAEAYPDYRVYRAWTSKMIMARLLKRDGLKINNVKQAMEQMHADGIRQVIIQPTHVINGIENDLMKADVLTYSDDFDSIRFGNPLLTTTEDSQILVRTIAEEFSELPEDEVLVLMGHGTTHYANTVYAALDYMFKDMGHPNIFLGTVEAYPSMESLIKQIQQLSPRKLTLAPFMIVAGDHAKNDMSSKDPASWRSQFEAAGFQVDCVLKGLGEYSGVRALLVQHVAEAQISELT